MTLGGLIDALTVVNLKLWAVQDWFHKAAAAAASDFAETPREEIHEKIRQLRDLNLRRNRLMTEIDALVDAGIKAGGVDVDSRPKFT